MKKILATTLAISIALSGCASSSGKVAATYASPLAYQTYDCTQIASESVRLQARMTELGGQVDKAADNDKVLTGVAVVLFWPAIFFLGNKQQEAEFGRIKGEYEAIQQAAIAKKCT
ncbi:MAG: hypothetical protein RL535_134 [Pseudomonadota bacterium]